MFGSMSSKAHQAHIALNEPMTSIIQQEFESRLPSTPTIIDLRVIDLVSSPVWWEAVTNNIMNLSFSLSPLTHNINMLKRTNENNHVHTVLASQTHTHTQHSTYTPRGVMVKAVDCGIVVREFVLQSRYYIHFRANTLGERYEPPYPYPMG